MSAGGATRRTAAIVAAAGLGQRMGPGAPKALRLLDGLPLLVHVTRALARSEYVRLIVVAAPHDEVANVEAILATEHDGADLAVVPGGTTRQVSVRRALAALPDDVDEVLVHDAARPLVPVELIDLVAATVRAGAQAVVPGVSVVDTIKRVHDEYVVETVDRTMFRAIQTPQGFRRDVLEAVHVAAAQTSPDHAATDDAALVEQAGIRVAVVPGADEAFKITRAIDLLFAEAAVAQRKNSHVC